jgi:hypothetical protein
VEISNEDVLFYAESIYKSALKNMSDGKFRKADQFALCAYSAANLLANDPKLGELRDQVYELRDAAWRLSEQAYSMARDAMLEPRMSGYSDMTSDSDRFKLEMDRLAKDVFRRKKP